MAAVVAIRLKYYENFFRICIDCRMLFLDLHGTFEWPLAIVVQIKIQHGHANHFQRIYERR
jgi:hypothetical protein